MKMTDPPAKAFEEPDSRNASEGRDRANGNNASEGRDPVTGQFLMGHKKSRGRPKGSRAKLGEKFFAALHDDFVENGVAAIARVRFHDPSTYLSVIAKLMPQKLEVAVTPTDGLSDDQLEAMIEFAERMAGLKTEQARVIEGAAMEVTPAALPAPAVTLETLATPPSRSPGRDAAAAAKRADLEDQAAAALHGEPSRPSAVVVDEINPEDLF